MSRLMVVKEHVSYALNVEVTVCFRHVDTCAHVVNARLD